MTGYGRGQSACEGVSFSVEVNSVNRKQSDVVINLPRELVELEPRLRDIINTRIARGRLNVAVAYHKASLNGHRASLDHDLAKSYFKAIVALKEELGATGEISIDTIVRAPGVLGPPDETIDIEAAAPRVEAALSDALDELIKMREREAKNLAKDLIQRLKLVRQTIRKIKTLRPAVTARYRTALRERISKAGVDLPLDDERLTREVIFFAEKSDISEEIIRLESHMAQFAHHLRRHEPVGRTLDFITQEINREFNTLGAKANDAEISQLVVTCKAEMEKIREQIQNIE